MALNEWGLTADVLNDQWTPELLWLMFRERSKEIQRIREMQRKAREAGKPEEPAGPVNIMSDIDLFKKIKGLNFIPKKAPNA